jgi:hypothetical protein
VAGLELHEVALSKRKNIRTEEYALHFDKSGDVHSINRAGEVLNTYVRKRPRLYQLWETNGITTRMFKAGEMFAALWTRSGLDPWQRAPHSDLDRPKVDGAGRAPDELGGSDGAKLALFKVEAELGSVLYRVVAAICGRDLSCRSYALEARLDRRYVKKLLREGLSGLAGYWNV